MASGNRLVILLSQRCNLVCGYCFAHDAHSNEVIDKHTLSNLKGERIYEKQSNFSHAVGLHVDPAVGFIGKCLCRIRSE